MRIALISIFLLFHTTLPSCYSSHDNLIKNNVDYFLKRSYFPKEFVAHFPDTIEHLPYNISVDTGIDLNHVFFCLMLQDLDSKKLESDLLSLQETFESYNPSDSDLFVINKFTNKYNLHLQNKFPDNYDYQDTTYLKQPVPNFWFIEPNSDTYCKLDSSFKLFVIDAKKGFYWDEKHLTIYNQMPENWYHGYSRGVAISTEKKTKIFWFAIW